MKSDPHIQVWEYFWYALTTLFLLGVGFGLLLFGLLGWLSKRLRASTSSWGKVVTGALLLGALGTASIYYLLTRTIDLGAQEVVVAVGAGDSFRSVADNLVKSGVISNRWSLLYPARLLKVDRKLQTGRYLFTGRNSSLSVLQKLSDGDVELEMVTIPEGMTLWRTASVLQAKLGIDSAQMLALSRDRSFLDSLNLPSLEGYLFPETYSFAPGVSLRAVVAEMVAMFHRRTDSLFIQQPLSGLNRYQSLILASIVEAETPVAQERSRVASVYLNRLRLGMTLDADPTVIYGLGGLDRPLNRGDLDSVTTYNTYRVAGLPPTPINSPGLASIEAALKPDGSDYLYFVADGSGGHLFSRTNEEHNLARRRAKLNHRN